LFDRAEKVIPGGIHGTRSPRFATFGDFPVFIRSASGCRFIDVDGNEYIDLMCAFGPIIVGYNHPSVELAAQAAGVNATTIPGEVTVELAETLIARWSFADWVMFGKNGSDVTTLATRVARAATGRTKILTAAGAYHGFDTWSNPDVTGFPPEYRTHTDYFEWNDPDSVRECFQRNRGDVAGLMMTPVKHDAMHDIEPASPEFLSAIREGVREADALLMIDDVRCGLRLHPSGASHMALGLEPDIVCFGKAIGNGHPIAILTGREALRETAKRLYFSATHFFAAVPMAAALATLGVFDEESAYERIQGAGGLLRDGMLNAAARAGVGICWSGPDAMPNMILEDDPQFKRGRRFSGLAARRGVIFHPRHNWFISSAHTPEDIGQAIAVAEECFELVAKEIADGQLA
jgi:glutamate-1-semialdehyde 2,1-aminomutase